MELSPITDAALADYREHTTQVFAAEKMRSEGLAADAAREAAESAVERAMSSASGHVISRLTVDGEPVGVMWFVVRPEWGQPCLWLYDIMIDADKRGKGFGRRAMELLEEEARRLEVATIGLHVFGHNTVARELYESIGFRPTSIVMRKEL